jgi:hypothetical protein
MIGNLSTGLAAVATAAIFVVCSHGEDTDLNRPDEPLDMQGLIDRELAAGNKKIVIPPGSYRVKPKNRQHLVLKGLNDVEIIANGVEMICTETTRALTIDNCRDVTVRGLTIDYDPLPYTQGRIVSMSEDKMAHEIELFDGYPSSEEVQPFKYEIFKPDTRTLRFGSYHDFQVESLDPKHIRVTKGPGYRNNSFKPEEVGDIIAIGTAHAPDGSIPHAVYINQCANVRLEDVTLYASNCFGFLETNCDGTTYLRCKIDRRAPETDLKKRADARIRSLNADAFHSKHAIKGPAVIGCIARFQGDDGINICGDYHMVTACDGKELRVLAKHGMNIEVGDPVELLTYLGERLPDAQVVKIVPDDNINDAEKEFLSSQSMNNDLKTNRNRSLTRAFRITLDRAVELPTGSIICSMRRTGNGFVVKDCDFGYNRSRGILIKASDGEVSGNTLTENWGEAIKVAPEYWWLESGSSNNVEIRGNVIRNCRSLAIAVYSFGGPRNLAPAGAHNNIAVVGNTITDCPLPNILVTSTKGLKVADNACEPSKTFNLSPGKLRGFKLDAANLEQVMTVNCEDCDVGRE